MIPNENDDIRQMLARIEQSHADLSHEIYRLRADLAILASGQNSRISDTKKKQTRSPHLSSGYTSGYSG